MPQEHGAGEGAGRRSSGWLLFALGAAIVGLGALSGMPYWRGESCSMALMGFVLSLPIGVPLMLLGAFVVWAAGRPSVSPQAGVNRPARWGGAGVDIAAFFVSAVLALVVVFTLGDPLVRDSSSGLAMGLLSLLACVVILWAARRRLRRA